MIRLIVKIYLVASTGPLIGCVSLTPRPPEVIPGCGVEAGYANGRAAIPYTNFCTPATEPNFLVGYGVGREARWLSAAVAERERTLECQKRERQRKFSAGAAPIFIDLGTHEANAQPASRNECESPIFRSAWELEQEIAQSEHAIGELRAKQTRVDILKSRIVAHPAETTQAVQDYLKTGRDEFDVEFRWQTYLTKKGGVENLNGSERMLLYQDINPRIPPPSELTHGALYGFGIGHARQGRFSREGWKYALFDSLVMGAIIYGVATHQVLAITAPAFIFGFTFSRGFQYYSVYRYNLEHGPQIDNLRTDRERPRSPAGATFSWNW